MSETKPGTEQLSARERQEQLFNHAHTRINEILGEVRVDEDFKRLKPTHGKETLIRSASIIRDTMQQDGLTVKEVGIVDGRKVNPMPINWLVKFLRQNPDFLSEIFDSYFIAKLSTIDDGLPGIGNGENAKRAKAETMSEFFEDLGLMDHYTQLTNEERATALSADFDRFMLEYATKNIMKGKIPD
ncbi:MAG: hypothetical protein AAB390_03375 [Patescibacteria group bacterium]